MNRKNAFYPFLFPVNFLANWASTLFSTVAVVTLIAPQATGQTQLLELSCPEQQKLLTQAAIGLEYPSESDYPLSYFRFSQIGSFPTASTFAYLVRSREPAIQINAEEFFQKATRIYPGMSQQQILTAKRFKVLEAALKANYTQLTIYRIGTVEVYIYIAGINSCGLTGLQTVEIET
ncbi:nuclease A inhibitor family protein [Merismopedia glauca]|uniref:Nuclease n=1 Tax=Merismopedia glauca CCAP 1448/3 TaxID=1296344 RepID=A0A2T1C9U4_9CYAN|nr:nuclease A inhibitor family protein [Merismopedia glauca]PSB04938.1 hypothetical protein C7B64_01540 [Merismopedia glauca CCAP 1448/3]